MKALLSLAVLIGAATPVHAQESRATFNRTQHDEGEVFVFYSAGVEALVSEPEDKALGLALSYLDDRLVELRTDFGLEDFPTEEVQLIADVLTGAMCLRVGLDRPDDPKSFRAQLTSVCSSAPDAQRRLSAFGKLFQAMGLATRTTSDGKALSANTPLGVLQLTSGTSAGNPIVTVSIGRALEERFELGTTDLPETIYPGLYAHFDPRQVGTLIESIMEQNGEDAESARQVFEFFGLAGANAPSWTWALGRTQGRTISAARTTNYVPHARSNGLLVTEPLELGDLRRLPSDTTWASIWQFPVPALLPLLDKFEEGTSANLRAMANGMLGFDPQTEFLSLLGPTLSVYGSVGTGGGGIASTVFAIETTNRSSLAKSLDKLITLVGAMAAEGAEGRVAFRGWEYRDVDCTTVVFPGLPIPLELSFALSKDALITTLTPGALEAALDQTVAKTSLVDHPRLGLSQNALTGLASFTFFDTEHYLERGYGTLSLVASGIGNAVRSPRNAAREPGFLMPSMRSLRSSARSWVGWSRLVDDDRVQHGVMGGSWVTNGAAMAGTPLLQTYTALAAVGIGSSVAIPQLMSARLSANERAAVATLRSLNSAQAQAHAMGLVDSDGDGRGEYAFLSEMAGTLPRRVPVAGKPSWGRLGRDEARPPLLSSALGRLMDDGTGEGVVERNGYYFKVFLPGPEGPEGRLGVSEPATPAATGTPNVDPDKATETWCGYAWPIEARQTGNRVFFINQDGDLLYFDNASATYSGLGVYGGRQPQFDSALTESGDFLSRPAVRMPSADGNLWLRDSGM